MYVFIRRPQNEPELHEIFRFSMVRGVVGFNGAPGRISEPVMAEFLESIGQAEPIIPIKKSLKAGNLVKAKVGSWRDLTGPIETIRGAKAKVILTLFNRSLPVEIAMENLELA
jgi:transcription antitermination factor NusG